MSVHQIGPGKYRVVVTKGRNPDGSQRRKDLIVQGTEQDALLEEAKLRVELEAAGPSAFRAVPTFYQFSIETYVPHAKANLRKTTWTRSRKYIVARLMEFFGPLPLDKIRPVDIERYKTERLKTVEKAAVNDDLKVLRAIFGLALDLEVIAKVPKMRRLRERGKRRIVAWTTEEVQRLFRATAEVSPIILPLVIFLANTGCRKGEALQLSWPDVDLETGLIRIWPSDEWQPKNGKPREIPISSALRPWLSEPGDGHVFLSSRGTRWVRWPDKHWVPARDRAKLRGGPHQLRHAYASHFLAERADLWLLAQILGHSHQRVTENYAHLLPDHLERARDAVNFAMPLVAMEGR